MRKPWAVAQPRMDFANQRPRRDLRLNLAAFLIYRLDRHAQVSLVFLVRSMNKGTDRQATCEKRNQGLTSVL